MNLVFPTRFPVLQFRLEQRSIWMPFQCVMSFMIMFFANACGVNVSVSMMIIILLANVLLSVGTPGIPGGAIASFAALATMAGLPAGVMGVYISINTLCDMGATCVNVIGDMAGCVVLQEKIDLK